jgi:predicted DNA-binding protein
VKTAISLPDRTFARVNDAAERLGLNRSEFFVIAVEHYLHELESTSVTADIDLALTHLGASSDNLPPDVAIARLAELTEGDEW